MPKRNELLKRNREAGDIERRRQMQENCIISALPNELDYDDVYTTRKHIGAKVSVAHGVVELSVQGYEGLAPLLEGKLRPVRLARITRISSGTRSFYPMARIPRSWHEDEDFAIAEIEDVMWQMRPTKAAHYGGNGMRQAAQICVEWFALLAGNYFVNVRATVKEHSCMYSRDKHGLPWRAHNVPSGQIRRTNVPDGPPFITVYWDLSCFNEDYTVVDHLAAQKQEVA